MADIMNKIKFNSPIQTPDVTLDKIVINEGVALGSASIAGGTTDIELIKEILGDGYKSLIDKYGSNIASWNDTILEYILSAMNTDLTVAELRQLLTISPSTAEGMLSIAFGASNKSNAAGSISFGFCNTSGAKGYYISNVDEANNSITLSTKQGSAVAPTINPAWDKNDILFITNGKRYFLTIKEFDASTNTVKLEEDLPFSSLAGLNIQQIPPIMGATYDLTSPNERSVVNISKPMNGEVVLGWGMFAFGSQNVVTGSNAYGVGHKNIAAGDFSAAFGQENIAGYAAFATGIQTSAPGTGSVSEGHQTTAAGEYAHAEGMKTTASGQDSHAEGALTSATGDHAHAEGYDTTASGSASHAGGLRTSASEDYQTVIGRYNNIEKSKNKAFVIGNGHDGDALANNAMTVDWEGNAEFAGQIKAGNNRVLTTADYITAGRKDGTIAGEVSTAEGILTTASGVGSHAEGGATIAEGPWAHAEGYDSKAIGNSSHAGGIGTRAERDYQTAIGMYNAPDPHAKFIVGVGLADNNRQNAFTAGNDGKNHYITIGTEILTEEQLKSIKEGFSDIETALDNIIAIQNSLIGGDGV